MKGVSVAIIGSGFAGVEAVKRLAGKCSECIWVSKEDLFQFLAALPEVAAGRLGRDDVAFPVSSYAKRHGFTFVKSEVTVVRVESNGVVVETKDGEKLGPYDYAILATGARPAFFGIPGAAEYTIPLYHVENAVKIRERLSKASAVVVVGAGLVGSEFAAEAKHAFPNLRVVLVDMLKEPIAMLGNREASRKVASLLQTMGVELKLGFRVVEVSPDEVKLVNVDTGGEERLKADVIVWSAGVQANTPRIEGVKVEYAKGGYPLVDQCLRVHERLFVVGDAACVKHGECIALKMAREAIRQAAHATKTLLSGRCVQYKPLISTCRPLAGVTLGPQRAVLVIGKSLAFSTRLVHWYKEMQRKKYLRTLRGG